MTDRSRPTRPQVMRSSEPAPLLADLIGLDSEDVAERIFGDFEHPDQIRVLVELSWDISNEDGWSSPAGGESGSVYLVAAGDQTWTVQVVDGEWTVDETERLDPDALVEAFLSGFADGNNDPVTVYGWSTESGEDAW